MMARARGHLWGLVALTAALLVAGAMASPPAVAAPTNAKVNGGALTVSGVTVPDFPGTKLNGAAQPVTATMPGFSVSDARGAGFGWNVTVQATQFAEWDPTLDADGDGVAEGGYVSGGKTLALNSLKLPTPSVAADGTTSPPPSVMTGPHRIDTTGAVKIASAATDTGMGKYNFSVADPLELTLPANAYAKAYRSSVTLSVVSGP